MHEKEPSYDRKAKILHWLSALFFLGALTLGLYFSTLDYRNDKVDYAKFGEWIYWHKTMGILVFLLVFPRLYHRIKNPPPPLPPDTTPWVRRSSHVAHWSLYGLIFVLALSGLIGSDIGNYPVKLFELWYLPQFPGKNVPLGDGILKVHMFLGDVAAGLVGLHIVASFYHHFVMKDTILTRMLPAKKQND